MERVFVLAKVDREIIEKQQLLSDRNKFYGKLNRIGYIPDEDMRNQVESIRKELERRIESLADNIVAIGG